MFRLFPGLSLDMAEEFSYLHGIRIELEHSVFSDPFH